MTTQASTPSQAPTTTARRAFTVALAGNPNCGKTTLFNNLTGAHQHVGNYGGVTVETKEGIRRHGGHTLRVVDLPGTYSLTAYSMEEVVAQDFILNHRPDVVVAIVDGSNLERNLYLPLQLAELGVPLVLAVNMADEMRRQGAQLDEQIISDYFHAPVVMTVGTRNEGTAELLDAIVKVAQGNNPPAVTLNYGPELEAEIEKLAGVIEAETAAASDPGQAPSALPHAATAPPPRWTAIKLLENDHELMQTIHKPVAREHILTQLESARRRVVNLLGEDAESVIAERRYGHAHGLCRAALRRAALNRVDMSDRIDKVLTNRLLGLPIFAVMMYVTFWLVFTLGEYPMNWIEGGIEALAGGLAAAWSAETLPIFRSLVIDGIITGVGGVIVFLPNIMLLFLALSLLEDTGYMARAAFIMDRLMKWVGLHGKSFIPMLSGFGCTVPAAMGTRILDNRRDRLTTILILPLMSCGARLPIYMLLIPAFFAVHQRSLVMYVMYIIGIVLAVVAAKVLRATVFKGTPSPFVMELPPYRIPTLRAVLLHMWQRSWLYLRKAGTIILAISVVMWALSSFPRVDEAAGPSDLAVRHTYAGRIGSALEPVMNPLGFDWRINTAMIGAFAAKEVFVAQMGIVFALEDYDAEGVEELAADDEAEAEILPLRQILRRNYTPLQGFCVMLFCLIAAPCMATLVVTAREAGWGWALAQWFGLTLLAYILTAIIYQAGTALNLGTTPLL